jgi:hypothetical protein
MMETPIKQRLEELVETLASIEHERWSHWQRYVHSQCTSHDPAGSLLIPADLVEQWERLIATPYAQLTEKEKESDREQVRRYLPLIARVCGDHKEE